MYTSFFKVNSHTFVGPPVAHLSFLVLYFFQRLTFELFVENLCSADDEVSLNAGSEALDSADEVNQLDGIEQELMLKSKITFSRILGYLREF